MTNLLQSRTNLGCPENGKIHNTIEKYNYICLFKFWNTWCDDRMVRERFLIVSFFSTNSIKKTIEPSTDARIPYAVMIYLVS